MCINTTLTPYRIKQIASWQITVKTFKLHSLKQAYDLFDFILFFKYTHMPKKVRVKFTKFSVSNKHELQMLLHKLYKRSLVRATPPLTARARSLSLTATDSLQKESIRHRVTLLWESIRERIILKLCLILLTALLWKKMSF